MTAPNPAILANMIRNWCETAPDRDVLTFVAVGANGAFQQETRSYQQLWDNGQRLAAWLRDKGMRKGDTFALVIHNHPEFVDFMVASSILGTVFVPIDARTRGDKLKHMLDFAQCKGAVVGNEALVEIESVWKEHANDTSRAPWIATLENNQSDYPVVSAVLAGPLLQPALTVDSTDPDAPMQLLYTSGTTGDPKAIMFTYSRYAGSANLPVILGLTAEDRPYTGLSLTHANAQVITLGMCLATGMRAVISRKFTKSRLWDITRKYGCTFFNLLGGMTNAIYAEPPLDNDADNPVRKILSAGMPAAIWEGFTRRFDVDLIEFYGAAEGGLTFNPPGIGPVGSCGKAPPSMQLAILDDNGLPCPPGVAGEICFREADGSGPGLTYFKNPEATAKKTAGGWLHMGDIGHLDENGWLFFHYRMGGGIRKNGDFVNPAFVEKALLEMPSVADAYVYGLAVSEGLAPGETNIVAAVVPADAASFNANALFQTCHDKLDRNSVPEFIQVLDEIPKTASEKPQERFLAEAFRDRPQQVHTARSRV